MTGWSGAVGLDDGAACAADAAGAAGHLRQELEGPLGGAEVAMGEAEIGVDDADQGELREIVALGDELRADDDVGFARGDRGELAPEALHAAEHVAGKDRHPRVREALGDLLGEALDARPAGNEAVLVAAARAGRRPRFGIAAMMADELAAKAVLDQPGGAVRALEAVAAGAAEGERCVAAPVEEEERLLLRREGFGDRRDQRRRRASARAPAVRSRRSTAVISGSVAPA